MTWLSLSVTCVITFFWVSFWLGWGLNLFEWISSDWRTCHCSYLSLYCWFMSVGCPTAASTAHPLFAVALVEEHASLFLLLKAKRCLFLTFFRPAKSQWRAEMIWVRVKAVCVVLQTEAKDHRRDDSQVLTVCLAHVPRFFQQKCSNMNIGSCCPFVFLTLSCLDNRKDYILDVSSHKHQSADHHL